MDNRNYYENENEYDWDDPYYGTGNTEPPKQRHGAMALMLILVIFLFGIITMLGILNIRLFQELKLKKKEAELSISFVTEATVPPETMQADLPQAASIEEQIQAKYGSKTEITVINGGQPIYYYIISVE